MDSFELARFNKMRERLRQVGRAYRRVVGAPDYDAYCAHMAAQHPGEAPLSRQAFCAREIDRRYGKSGPRCC